MLHVLQYLTGTSMAEDAGRCDLMTSQAVVGGASVSGSSLAAGGGKRWTLRGRICEH